MADDKQEPGVFNVTVVEGDPYTRLLTITSGGDPWVLPTTGWLGQIKLQRGKDAEVVDEWTIDATQAGSGLVTITLPELEAGRYYHDIECASVRTLLAGTITVTKQVSDDD